ncbi:Uncharacterised protein [Legionella beliardensis]|uniref:Uncharacterized protein n=1 Tax=Legionella beliardensis TaxID=91822 RepID=A0A378I100_9GAMM|nr:glycine zipper family protein [Legionella beliardensis]STX28411.1 Uncharacterised protein [Legionella beliardensis]
MTNHKIEKLTNYYLKQDSHEDKNICEVFASQFMRFIAQKIGEDPAIIADVSYVNLQPNEQIYIASKLYAGYRDLFLDAYLAYHLPAYQNLRSMTNNKWAKLPKQRPYYFQHDPCIDSMTEAGRYKEISIGLALRSIVDDPDTHFKNIGAVPVEQSGLKDIIPIYENGSYSGYCLQQSAPASGYSEQLKKINIADTQYYQLSRTPEPELDEFKEACIKYNHHYYLVPNIGNTQAVHVDFGGSLGDFRLFSRRKLDGKIHLRHFCNLLRYHPSYSGPPAYFNQISDALTSKATYFYETLARFSMIDKFEIADFIDEQINNTFDVYQNKPDILIRFAERIGLEINNAIDLPTLNQCIQEHLLINFVNRQQHAKALFLEHFCNLDYTTQLNLMNGYQRHDALTELSLKERLIREFFHNLKNENKIFFATFKAIEDLNLNSQYKHYARDPIWQLKKQLHQWLSQAYLDSNLEESATEINEIIKHTQLLLNEFIDTKSQLDALPAKSSKKAYKLALKFILTANQYEQCCAKTLNNENMKITAATLTGALIGAIVGAGIGVILGGVVLAPVTSITGAAIGIKLGLILSTAFMMLLAGVQATHNLTRYHLFSSLNHSISNLSQTLSTPMCQEIEQPQFVY